MARHGPADIEAEEAEILAVGDDRDAGDRLVAEEAHQEAVRIGGEEGVGVVEAGVPSFRRRPFDRRCEVGWAHRTNGGFGHELFSAARNFAAAPRALVRGAAQAPILEVLRPSA